MFKKDLSALVKGIRSHKKDEQTFIEAAINEMKKELTAINEMKKELKDPDVAVKANAIEKLTYLQMFGYSMDWAAFNIIEVMTSSKFTHKRIGYLAASQSWKEDTDVILLSTNLLKKGVALNCLANICTKDLARDIASDLVALLNTSRPYIRKKAILCLFRIFLKFPQALRPAFPRLREKLEDPEMPVVSAAVNVICELARKNPKNYLQLSQTFFRILTSSNNNWMLIKIIKLFGALTPLEKRLGKKLAEPLTNIINTTPATSLLYEAIQTCIIGLSHDIPVMRLCITKLRDFIVDPDQNLKYLGLLALHKIMQVHPKAVNEHRDTVIRCLDDPDTTIRSRALDLVSGMVSRRNIMDIIQKLVEKIDVTDDPIYKDDLVQKCIEICSQNNTYSFITDFDWYIQVLLELTHVRNTRHGNLISAQLLDVVTRVKVVRSLAVRCMADLLKDSRLVIESPDTSTLFEVLHAAAYICGEYAELVEDPHQVMEGLLQPRVLAIAPHLQAIFMQNVLKLFAFVVSQVEYGQGGEADLLVEELITLIRTRLEQFVISSHTEVQERACFALALIDIIQRQKSPQFSAHVSQLFAEPLRPVAADAQQRVPLPEDLDLDTQINVIPQHDPKDDWNAINNSFGDPLSSGLHSNSTSDLSTLGFDPSVSSTYQSSASRLGSPYILGAAAGSSSSMAGEVILPPEHQIEALPAEFAVGSAFGQRLRKYTTLNQQGASPKTRRRLERERKARLKTKVEILHEVDAPEVFPTKKPSAQAVLQIKDEDDLSKIDLSAPLDPAIDVLPVQQHRVVTNSSFSSSLPAAAAQQPQTPPSKVVQPVDPIFGKAKRGRKVRRDGQRRAKPTKAKAAAVTGKVGSQLLDLDFGHETLPSPAHSTPSPARLAAASPAPVSSSSPAPASASSSQPQLSFSDPAAPALLTSDSNIQLLFAPQFSPETGKVLVTFGLKNVGKAPLSRFKFGLSGPILQQAPVSPDFALPPGAECSTQVLFGFDSSQAIATKFPSTLEFATASGSAFMLSFDLSFPCTCFLAPAPISTDRFAAFSASCPALVSKKLRAPAGFAKALESIVAKGHLFVVEKMESAAMCHASGPLGSSLIFLVKRRSPHSVSLEIKSQAPHQAFITILAKEF